MGILHATLQLVLNYERLRVQKGHQHVFAASIASHYHLELSLLEVFFSLSLEPLGLSYKMQDHVFQGHNILPEHWS